MLALFSSHSPLIWYPAIVAITVKPTKVTIVNTANTLRTPTTAPLPSALAANATGRMVKSGEAATPNGTTIAANLLAPDRSFTVVSSCVCS